MAVIREDRDAAFWNRIANDPDVIGTLFGQPPEAVGFHMADPRVRHFSTERGGWAFVRLDSFGLIWDTHAMFTPDGWGREANAVLKHALRSMFEDAHMFVVTETDNPRSRPPLSFGFRSTGGVSDTFVGPVRTWALTRAAWASSPACRRA